MSERRVGHGAHGYLRMPTLAVVEGSLVLHALATRADDEALLAFDVGEEIGEPRELQRESAIRGLTRGVGIPTPTSAVDATERFELGDGASVRVERDGGTSAVWLRDGARETLVWTATATAAAPTALRTGDGVWVAFHHNLREDTGEADLTKWIALRFVDHAGDVRAPVAPMTDRDRDRHGEEQGFEFPTLVQGADGSIALFGRGSHAFFRQDLNAAGFDERRALGTTDWGCRGRWVSALAHDGRLWTARREKPGIEVCDLDLPRGGPPKLEPAVVRPASRPHRDVPPRPPGEDPAHKDGRRTLFGDIHQHSAHSDGVGTADEPYLRARYVYGDDFCALTDHESFIGKRIGRGEWAHLCAVADAHDAPGRFATLLAYEWTGKMYPGPGHKVVYLPPSGGTIVSRDDVPDGAELVARVKAQGGFAVPHHIGWTGADEGAHDPEGQPVFEICSCHGCYLYADHPLGGRGQLQDQMVDAVMKRGLRFGFIACSDGHGLLYHHGVGRKRDPFRCGLTAVQAKDCTREAILEAIRERRCYATSGVPILLDLRAGEHPMGSMVRIDAPVLARAEVKCATPVASLALMGPAGELARCEGDGDALELFVEARVGPGWVYAVAEQRDGEMAWSSAVFLDA
ncbi:MAG: DUF3604 domain-containing protein [Sandaracinaceae bacterium]